MKGEKMITLRFEPKEDITTWELAQIFKLDTMMDRGKGGGYLCIPGNKSFFVVDAYFDSLLENVKRHLIIKEE
jgi:hypothetical protein